MSETRTEAAAAEWTGLDDGHLARLKQEGWFFDGELSGRGGWRKYVKTAETFDMVISPVFHDAFHMATLREWLLIHQHGTEIKLTSHSAPTFEEVLEQAGVWETEPPE